MIDLIGQQLGNYRLIRLIGRGGFAEVYLGEHVHLGSQAAIKVLHAYLGNEEVEQFRREARTIVHLVHPHIVRIFDFDVKNGLPFLVMDYAPNGSLRQRYPRGTPLALPLVVVYVKQVAAALQYAHDQGFVHRDVKPDNMLLGRHNELVLSDFGIATIAHRTSSQSVQVMTGTIPYMAPEQIQGRPRPASDQYALGIVVYEWLTGDRPFQGSFTEIASQHVLAPPPSMIEKIPGIPPEVERVVLIALEKDPHRRFANIQAFATALEQAAQSVPASPEARPAQGTDEKSGTLPAAAPEKEKTSPPAQTLPPTVPIASPRVSLEPTVPVAEAESTTPISSPSITPVTSPPEQIPARSMPESGQKEPRKVSRSSKIVMLLLAFFIVVMAGAGITYALLTTNNTVPGDSSKNSSKDNSGPYGGTLLVSDPMSGPARSNSALRWEVRSDQYGRCSFTNNAYHVYGICDESVSISTKFALEIHLSTNGNCGNIHFYSHSSSLPGDVTVCASSYYQIRLNDAVTNGEVHGTSLAVHPESGQTDIIAIVSDGTHVTLFINGVRVASAAGVYTDLFGFKLDGYAPSSDGMASSNFAEVVFSDIRIWSLA